MNSHFWITFSVQWDYITLKNNQSLKALLWQSESRTACPYFYFVSSNTLNVRSSLTHHTVWHKNTHSHTMHNKVRSWRKWLEWLLLLQYFSPHWIHLHRSLLLRTYILEPDWIHKGMIHDPLPCYFYKKKTTLGLCKSEISFCSFPPPAIQPKIKLELLFYYKTPCRRYRGAPTRLF